MLCPAGWTDGETATIVDKWDNCFSFSEDVDAVTIPGYVIYKTPVWSDTTTVKLIVGYEEVKSVDFSTMSAGAYDGTIEKGKAEIIDYDGKNALRIGRVSNVRIIEGFEVDSIAKYTTIFWVKADKDASFNVTFSGNKVNGNTSEGRWSINAGEWRRIVVEAQSAEGVTDGYLRIDNGPISNIYISKVKVIIENGSANGSVTY